MWILKYLGVKPTEDEPASAETETVRKISRALDGLAPERARLVAGFAFILSRVAHADLDISDEETATMERLVRDVLSLPEPEAVLAVQIAKTQSKLFGSTENFVVTREFGKTATHEQKLALLECLFAVSAADQSISTIEAGEISTIAHELKIARDNLIAARSAAREFLAVLKKDQP